MKKLLYYLILALIFFAIYMVIGLPVILIMDESVLKTFIIFFILGLDYNIVRLIKPHIKEALHIEDCE